jgi:hypothetical protein
MAFRYINIVLISLGMACHSLVVGRYLESMFFMAAFAWAWVGFASLRGNLHAAKTMAQTMIAITIGAAALLPVLGMSGGKETALISLALLPGGISWVCVLLYINYIMSGPEERDQEMNADFARSLDAWTSPPPVPSAAHPFMEAPVAAEELTSEKVAKIVGRDVHQDRQSNAA